MSRTLKIGHRETTITPGVLCRIEARTGLTCGQIMDRIREASSARPANIEHMTDAERAKANAAVLGKMADLTLITRTIGAVFDIPDPIVHIDFGSSLFDTYGKVIEAFIEAFAALNGPGKATALEG